MLKSGDNNKDRECHSHGNGVIFCLVCSNIIISAIRRFIPEDVRIPVFVTIISGFVTIFGFIAQAYLPAIYVALGIYLPLITVNCNLYGRAEAFAQNNPVLPTFMDGLGIGAGYTLSILGIAVVREVLGFGEVWFQNLAQFKIALLPFKVGVLQQPAGGYIVMAGYLISFTYLSKRKERKRKEKIAEERRMAIESRAKGAS